MVKKLQAALVGGFRGNLNMGNADGAPFFTA
jgi:hypothetical protein